MAEMQLSKTPLNSRWRPGRGAAAVCSIVVLLGFLFPRGVTAQQPSPRRPAVRAAPSYISTPEEQGMDADMLAVAYARAAEIPRMYSMLVVRHGRLVAEGYFDTQNRKTPRPVASAGKSVLGALVGIALEEGFLADLDQRMIDFFPDYDVPSLDPRKRDITIRHLLMMRSGYPADSTIEFFNLITASPDWFQLIIVDWPLERSPGTAWAYSNAGTHLLSGILTRVTGMSLLDFANLNLFGRMGQPIPYWPRDPQGYCTGPGDVFLSPLQMASFGLLILDRGRWRGLPVLATAWVDESLEDYSETAWENFWPYRNIRYGYLWWYAEVDGHEVHFAWGHGGQFITVVPSLDLVVVTTADNFLGDFSNASWYTEGSIFRMIAKDVLPAAY